MIYVKNKIMIMAIIRIMKMLSIILIKVIILKFIIAYNKILVIFNMKTIQPQNKMILLIKKLKNKKNKANF